ncbi:porin [Thalassotalea litorea]|uniref:porin n=1 Tax=Thalassotalea litorea TaxID=2020715 RepID=UPI003736FAD1
MFSDYPLKNKNLIIALCIFSSVPFSLFATESADLDIVYEDQITHISSEDGNFYLKPELRFQFRYSTPFEMNPVSVEELLTSDNSAFEINRARLKAEGHVGRPWFEVKFEYDLKNSRLLDARITLAKYEWLQFRFGRMKAHYNPERVASSKDLTLVDRTMVNDYFTADRQQGITLMGRLDKQGFFDSNYWFDISMGEGRDTVNDVGEGADGSNNNKFMWIAHYQWNFLGEKLGSAMSDLAIRQKPAANIGVAALKNTSRYSGFDSNTGTQLPGFEDYFDNEQYTIEQWMLHGKFHFNGLSLQGEYHQKDVIDNIVSHTTSMRGYYLQAGLILAGWWDTIPPEFEITGRFSDLTPDTANSSYGQSEWLLGMNWYFFGHRNKVTTDFGQFSIDERDRSYDDTRFRVQYDLSF